MMMMKINILAAAVLLAAGTSGLAAVPAYAYSENGDVQAAVVTTMEPAAPSEYRGYSENGDVQAAVVAMEEKAAPSDYQGFSENGDYTAARA